MKPPLRGRKGGKGGLKAAKGDEEEKEDASKSSSSSEDALSSLEQLGIITEAKEEKEEAKATVLEAKDEDATTGRKTPSSTEGEGGEDDMKLPVLFRMIKKGFRGPPRAGEGCLLYTSPSPRDATLSRMPSSA